MKSRVVASERIKLLILLLHFDPPLQRNCGSAHRRSSSSAPAGWAVRRQPTLAGAGMGAIGVVDGDTVEASNLHRQIAHGSSRVGMPKVDSLIAYLRE